MERNVLVGGLVLLTHEVGTCLGEFCTIHNPSDHHMTKWKQEWLGVENYMVRICPHGQSHPDPDEINLKVPENHGCDGCCDPASQFMDDVKELVREYRKPDYLTPTSIGPFYSGNFIEIPAEADDHFFDDILTKLDSLSIRKTEVSIIGTDEKDAKELR